MSKKEKEEKIKRQIGRSMILVFACHGRTSSRWVAVDESSLAKRPLSWSVKQLASSFFHESIVRFFSISFRIRCQPFWVPVQAQLAQPRPHAVFDQSQNRSVCKFRPAAVRPFFVRFTKPKHDCWDQETLSIFATTSWVWKSTEHLCLSSSSKLLFTGACKQSAGP